MATDPNSTDGTKRRKTSLRPTKSGIRRGGDAQRLVRYPNQTIEQRFAMLCHMARMRKLTKGRPVGSYDGYRKAERDKINAEAAQYAKDMIKTMADKGIITDLDDPRAVEALESALAVMRTPANQPTKLQAAKLILEYTKAKPAAKSEITVNKAEEWLAAVASEEKHDNEEGNVGDAEAAPK